MRIGQQVECIDDRPDHDRCWRDGWPVKGKVYTIGGFAPTRHGEPGLYFIDLTRRSGRAYRARRFRPIVDRATDISVFTRVLIPQKELA